MKKKIQVNKNHYDFSKYVNKERFMSYYYQLKYIYNLNSKNILEIGPGNNFLKNNLKEHFNIKTLDIDQNLKPDFVGSIDKIPLKNNSFDLIVCFQVLEHLPFNKFEVALKELKRVSRKDVLISLPYSGEDIGFQLKIPFLGIFSISKRISKFYKKHKFDGQHYWEIGKKGYSKSKIIKILKKYFIIKEIKNPYENKYHIFFKLRKKYERTKNFSNNVSIQC